MAAPRIWSQWLSPNVKMLYCMIIFNASQIAVMGRCLKVSWFCIRYAPRGVMACSVLVFVYMEV
eukprot:5520244-Ditylum_brightwellii.AAC.1